MGNARGDILWWTQFSVGGQKYNELWLSTLVPEPSALWALLIPLVLCARRAQERCSLGCR